MGLTPEDRLEIAEIYARWAYASDSPDPVAWAATFTEDGVCDLESIGIAKATGRDELEALIRGLYSGAGGAQFRHWNNNLVFEGDGDQATGTCYVLTVNVAPGPPAITATAIYHDTLTRTEDGWRFAHRSLDMD